MKTVALNCTFSARTYEESAMQNARDASKLKPRLFLICGSGYVGLNLIRHFIAVGFEVVALARSEPSLQVAKTLGAVPFAGDLLDAGLVEGMKGCQTLINAAADTDHGRGPRNNPTPI